MNHRRTKHATLSLFLLQLYISYFKLHFLQFHKVSRLSNKVLKLLWQDFIFIGLDGFIDQNHLLSIWIDQLISLPYSLLCLKINEFSIFFPSHICYLLNCCISYEIAPGRQRLAEHKARKWCHLNLSRQREEKHQKP